MRTCGRAGDIDMHDTPACRTAPGQQPITAALDTAGTGLQCAIILQCEGGLLALRLSLSPCRARFDFMPAQCQLACRPHLQLNAAERQSRMVNVLHKPWVCTCRQGNTLGADQSSVRQYTQHWVF